MKKRFDLSGITFAPEGRLIEWKPRIEYHQEVNTRQLTVGGGKYVFHVNRAGSTHGTRGEIKGFSRRSRSRLNKRMNMLKKHVLPTFLTLTYGSTYPTEFEVYKSDLHKFYQALKYHRPDIGMIWKLEFQERGAPHFHALVWGLKPDDLSLVVDLWHKIAGYGDLHHKLFHLGELRDSRPCLEPINSFNGVIYYSAKYLAKVDEKTEHVGRIWGTRGFIPYSTFLNFKVSLHEALEFRKALQEARDYDFKRLGFWCTDYDFEWVIFLMSLPVVPEPEFFDDWDEVDFVMEDIAV